MLKCKYFWKMIHIFSKIQCWRERCARDDLRGCYWEGRSRRQPDRKQTVLERAAPPCKYNSRSGCCVSFHSPGLGHFLKRVFLSIPFPLSSFKIVSFNLFIVFLLFIPTTNISSLRIRIPHPWFHIVSQEPSPVPGIPVYAQCSWLDK